MFEKAKTKLTWTPTKMVRILLLLFASTPLFGAYEDWDTLDKNLWKSYLALNVIDTGQTFDLIKKQRQVDCYTMCNLIETNPLLGKNPSRKEFLALKVVTVGVSYYLLDINPDRRTLVLGIMNGIYIDTVLNNHEIGLRVKFSF